MSEIKNGRYIEAYGTIAWYKNGQLHREDDLPAIEAFNGTKKWYFQGQLHRVNKHAVEYYNGDKEWFEYGKRHRMDGPAMCYGGINYSWFLYGVEYSKEKYYQMIEKKKLNLELNNKLAHKKDIHKIKI